MNERCNCDKKQTNHTEKATGDGDNDMAVCIKGTGGTPTPDQVQLNTTPPQTIVSEIKGSFQFITIWF